jgi:elongation factor Ts
MAISAALVKELRERTGLGILDCKQALEEVAGDVELAIEELRKKSALKAAKKAGRTTADGILGVKVAPDGKRAAIVEVNIETDFAAKNEKFIAFVDAVVDAVYVAGNDNLEAVLASGLEAEREVLVQEIGENVSVRRAACLVSEDGYIASYLHGDDRKATLVELAQVAQALGRDVAMHVTATSPLVVEAAEVPADVLAKEREIYASQARDSGKPADIIEKMVEGRVRKYLAEVSLLDQPFVKDPKTTVGQLIAAQGNQCRRFVRFEVGEGIDVEVADFAAEVAAQIRSSDDPDDPD